MRTILILTMCGLEDREEAKKRFYEIMYARPTQELSRLFGDANWINWINKYKGSRDKRNSHTDDKPHSNLAWLLQTTEVQLMKRVWSRVVANGIPFLTVHDEIIVREEDAEIAERIMHEVLRKNFKSYKLNKKLKNSPELNRQNRQNPQFCPFHLQNMVENLEYHLANGRQGKFENLLDEYYSIVEAHGAVDDFVAAIKRYGPLLCELIQSGQHS